MRGVAAGVGACVGCKGGDAVDINVTRIPLRTRTRQHVLRLREVLHGGRHARVPRDFGEGEGVGLGRRLGALELRARRDEAVEDPGPPRRP